MSDLIEFAFDAKPVRVVMIGDEPWFVASDLCAILGLGNVTMAVRKLDADQVTLNLIEGMRNNRPANIVSESGMWTLVLRSDRPEAVDLRRWLTGEVLPALRKTGRYVMPGTDDAPEVPGDHDAARLTACVGVVREARRLFGPQSARLIWVKLGLPSPLAADLPGLSADPMAADLEAYCASVGECTIDEAAEALGVRHLDAGTRVRIGGLLRQLGWRAQKVRRGPRTVNLFTPASATARAVRA